MTKNRAKRGEVHLSLFSMRSKERGQRLQNTVPSIMHTSRDEKPTVTGPILNSSMARDAVEEHEGDGEVEAVGVGVEELLQLGEHPAQNGAQRQGGYDIPPRD